MALLTPEKRRLLSLLLKEKGIGAAPQRITRRPAGEAPLPLSYAQQRLWFIDQLQPFSSAYNIPAALRLSGPLSLSALRHALSLTLSRHESLRTSFSLLDGHPVQVVAPDLPLPLRIVDLEELDEEERARRVRSICEEEAAAAFDLSRAPLWRAVLIRLSNEEHVLVMVMHHIISDGWSLGVMLKELGEHYEAQIEGREEEEGKELEIQYGDYAVWERERLKGEIVKGEIEYWREQLKDAPALLELPSDHRRASIQSMRGATERLVLPANLAEELRALGHREDATLFMTMLAAFETLLYRYTGQDDLVLGTPVANRQRVETEHLIGLLANTLVLRTRFDGDESFRQLLQRVREVTLGAYAHQDLPFEKLVEELRPERSLSHTPLFQVMFVQHNAPGGTMRFGNLKLEIMEAHNRTSKFDLTMFVEDRDEELAVWLEYTPDLFDAATIRRMLRHFQVLLEGIAASPEESLSRLPLLEPEERGQLLFEWNDTREEFDAEHILHALFEQQAERTPGHCALVFEDRSLTYAELNARANQLAHFLRSRGVRTETRVGILMERSVEMVVALLGVLKASGAYVPLDPAYPRERLAFMLQDAQALVLLTQERFAGNLPEHGAEVVRLDSGWQQLASESTENPLHTVVPDNLAYVIYTSGSTGQPKGAMNTHRGVCNRLLWGQRAYGLSESDRVLQKTPFSFDVSVWEFFWPLLSGASLVLARPGGHQDSEYLTALIRAERISTIHFVPSMLQLFLESGGFEHCPGLRRVMCSGEALPYGLQERFFARSDAELHNLYGPTEASIEVTSWECRRAGAEETVPIGRPISNAQIYLLDEQMQPVPVGVPGELHIGGTCVARGYLKRPALTAEKFIPHPFSAEPGARLYKSGDLARHLPDGNVDYLGRIDQQIKLRGFRIELGEIEGALGQHPLVRECVVLAREDEPGEKRIAAYLTTRAPQAPSTGELRAYLKERLPEYMIPSYFVMLEELPLSPNGKLDRKRLPAPGGARPELREKYEAPRNERERTLSGIWSEVLGVDQVGIHDDFFELGGHSLIATRVLSRMNQTFKAELPLRCMFDSPTVAGLAALLEQTPQEAPAAAPPSIATVSRDAHRRKLSSFIDKPFETGKSQAN